MAPCASPSALALSASTRVGSPFASPNPTAAILFTTVLYTLPLVSAVLCSWLICSASASALLQVSSFPLTLRPRPEARVPRAPGAAQLRPSTACSWPRPLLPDLAPAFPRAGARSAGRPQPLFRPRASTHLFPFSFPRFLQQFDSAQSNYYMFKFPRLKLKLNCSLPATTNKQ